MPTYSHVYPFVSKSGYRLHGCSVVRKPLAVEIGHRAAAVLIAELT